MKFHIRAIHAANLLHCVQKHYPNVTYTKTVTVTVIRVNFWFGHFLGGRSLFSLLYNIVGWVRKMLHSIHLSKKHNFHII